MDQDQARARLTTERDELRDLLSDTESAVRQEREEEFEIGDSADHALPLGLQGTDESIADTLRERLGAVERALRRLDDGTYGRSVRSGLPIPDERLDADPAAELTMEEARAAPSE